MNAERAVDYLCNAFTPDRQAVWDGAIAKAGIPVKVRRDDSDSFAEPAAMIDRMDELGIATLVLPTADLTRHGLLDPVEVDHISHSGTSPFVTLHTVALGHEIRSKSLRERLQHLSRVSFELFSHHPCSGLCVDRAPVGIREADLTVGIRSDEIRRRC